MEGLRMIPMIALVLAISGVVLGASVITLTTFRDNLDATCFNASYSYTAGAAGCVNNTLGVTAFTGPDNTNLSDEGYALVQAIDGQEELSEQLPTVAVIGIMVIIIAIIAGVFVYMRYFG